MVKIFILSFGLFSLLVIILFILVLYFPCIIITLHIDAYVSQRNHMEQILLNKQLTGEISELQREAQLIREIPHRLCESVANCKEIYKDVMSIMQVNPDS